MKCYNCGNELTIKNIYHYKDEYIGQYDIENCEHHYCENCGDEYVPFESCLKIQQFEKVKISELLKENFPIETNEYLSAKDLAKLEKCQEIDILKSKCFNNFVYHTYFNGEKKYLKKSYEIHKQTGNIGFLKLFKDKGN